MTCVTTRASREYRVRWWTEASRRTGVRSDPGDYAIGWAASDEPERLRQLVIGRAWPTGTVFEVAFGNAGADGVWKSVMCDRAGVRDWNPLADELPKPSPGLLPPISTSTSRLSFLRSLREAVDTASEAGIISPDDAMALLLAARDAVERMSRTRRERR